MKKKLHERVPAQINRPRRQFLQTGVALGAMSMMPRAWSAADTAIVRAIPGRQETIPVIGMGSWGTFDVGGDTRVGRERIAVLRQFLDAGGTLIDSSPMYGTSEATLGFCLDELKEPAAFRATKVWVVGAGRGVEQMGASEKLWGAPHFDLMQIHNFVAWREHLETLRQWREEGRVRYIGITTSHGRRGQEMAEVIATEADFDFVQFTYNIADRDAERRLLPLAADHGKAVIVNRPFRRKQLLNAVQRTPLPEWAGEIECQNWAQFLLKFIVSHPAVTCVIPATSRVDHMVENMGACYGPLPDAAMRKRMIDYFEKI